MAVKVKAFAKVNLTLEVFGLRPDGFHALRSVVLPIGLFDTLTFTPAPRTVTDTGYPDDLILKAFRVLAQRVRRAGPSYAVHVVKRIPSGGGLGGGSADAAVTLLTLNRLWKLQRTPEELADIGAEVGSDVPALVLANRYRAPVLMEGRGEIVSLLPLGGASPSPLHIVLANPGVSSSTAAVYGQCVPRRAEEQSGLHKMTYALALGDVQAIAPLLMNDLQKPAVKLYPRIRTALSALRLTGARGMLMSGSGSTAYGLFASEEEARTAADDVKSCGFRAQAVESLSPLPSRA